MSQRSDHQPTDSAALLRTLSLWSGRVTAVSALIAAGGFAGTVAAWGSWMAVGLALYGGTPEPDVPALPFPFVTALAPLGIGLLSVILEPIVKRPWLTAAALVLALVSAGVTASHLLALVEIAAG